MTREFTKWLRDYESRRTDPDRQFRIPSSWHSTKYPLEDLSWDEIRNLPVPEMQCSFGEACEAMRKSWFHYKMLKKEGDRGWDSKNKQNSTGIRHRNDGISRWS